MTEAEVRGLFELAQFEIKRIWRLNNGYYGGQLPLLAKNVPRLTEYEEGKTLLNRETLAFLESALPSAREPWWLVQTEVGLIEIGWRKRVINIDWSATGIRIQQDGITNDSTTKDAYYIHAWTIPKALEYLDKIHLLLVARAAVVAAEATKATA